MVDRIFKLLTPVAVLFFVALVILAVPSFFDPEFEVINRSSDVVSVVATWRDNEKVIDALQPMSSYQFSVDDEAGMAFRVRYSDGTEIESEPKYFSSGMKVIAIITSDGIDVRYDFES